MVDKNQIIEQIIEELNFRSREGYPLLKKSSHIELLSEILTELGLSSIKHELIENLLIEDEEEPLDDREKERAKKMGLVWKGKGYGKEEDDFISYKNDGGKLVKVDKDGESEPEETKTAFSGEAGDEFKSQLPKEDPAYKPSDVDKAKKKKIIPKKVDNTEIGKVVSETGDSEVKNTMFDEGYKGYEKKTGSKPAPGGPGSAFNEIVSGELVLILEKYPNTTEEELANYSHKRFGGTTLGKEQKETAGIPKNPELEKRRKEAIGNGKASKPQFPEQYNEVMQERASYSKSRVSARSAIKKHRITQQRIKNLQSSVGFGKETKTFPFYGADASISAQVDMVNNAKGKVYLPNGTEVEKDDLNEFIKAGGGGMNPSDTATFVTDENGNLLVQFHSDKTTTQDIQDNSTLANEENNYNSYIEKSLLNEDDKAKAKDINKEYSTKMTEIEEKYNNQSVTIASNLLELDTDKIAKIISNDKGTLVKNMDYALYGETAWKKGDFTQINKKWDNYLPKGVKPEDLTNIQKAEMIYKFANDGNKLNAPIVKSINKVALQYQEENPTTVGLDVKKLLSEQRREVVEMQREKIQVMNDYQADVDGVKVGLGTLMEAEENIRGFHLTMMDYPPKAYRKGSPNSIAGASLDVNMGGTIVNGEVLRGCLGVESTTEFKQKFELVEEEALTYDSNEKDKDGNPTGNVTGKKVFTYVVDGSGGKKELGYKTYRSKEGAVGKTSNTMTYSTEMQSCFKSKS